MLSINSSLSAIMVGLLAAGFILAAFFSARETSEPNRTRLYRLGMLVAGCVALLATWYFVLVFLVMASEGTLAPWHSVPHLAPPQGSWERELNDFFNRGSNIVLPFAIVLGVDLVLVSIKLLRVPGLAARSWMPAVFAMTNVGFIIACLIVILVYRTMVNTLSPLVTASPQPALGYQWRLPEILLYLVLTVILLRSHWRVERLKAWAQTSSGAKKA